MGVDTFNCVVSCVKMVKQGGKKMIGVRYKNGLGKIVEHLF